MNPLLNPVFLGQLAWSYLVDVNRVWRASEEQIERYQLKQLKKLLRYAYTVPLYHEKYRSADFHPDDLRSLSDVQKIPFITKKDLRGKKADVLLPKGVDVSKYNMVSTSGSTGQPVTLYSDAYTIFHTFIGFIRMIREHNVSWRKTRMALIVDLSPDSAEDAYFRRTALPNLRSFFSLKNMQAFNVNEKPETLLQQIERFQPEFVGGYPGIVKILAVLKRQGLGGDLQPDVIGTSGAILDEYTREYIQKAFDAHVFDVYGATECSPIAFECHCGQYHLHSDFALMEFLDPKEKEELTGDGGNIIVSRLHGRGTPVIRYSGLSDHIVPGEKTCECGIHTPVLDRIEGRHVDCILLPSGDRMPPSAVTGIPHKVMYEYQTDKIQQFQVIQQSTTEIDILLVIDEQLRNKGVSVQDIFKKIQQLFEEKVGAGVRVRVKEVKEIKTVRAGSITPPPLVLSYACE